MTIDPNPNNLSNEERAVYQAAFGASFVLSRGNAATSAREARSAVIAYRAECARYCELADEQ